MARKSHNELSGGPRFPRGKPAGPFDAFSAEVARLAGRPLAFIAALLIVLLWAVAGPLLGFSDTWQLTINTSTTIVTFLMVFLIQHTQNRDALALQIKVAELLIAVKGADDDLATAEDLSEETLNQLHKRLKETSKTVGTTKRHRGRRRSNGKSTTLKERD